MPKLVDGRYVLSAEATYAIIWVSTVIVAITTLLRLYARTFIVKALGLDDLLIFCSLIVCTTLSALLHWHLHSIWDAYNTIIGQTLIIDREVLLNKSNLSCRSSLFSDNCYVLVLPIAKCSILAFYRRISPSKKHRYLLYAFGFAIVLQAIINVLLRIFALDPPSAWWNCFSDKMSLGMGEARYNFRSLLTVNSSFQALVDIVILVLPLPIISRTKFNRRRRVGLLIIYLLSFLSLGATLAQLVNIVQNVELGNVYDPVEAMSHRIKYIYWAIVEVTTLIICANLPTMPVLVHNFKPLLRTINLSSLSIQGRKDTDDAKSTNPPVSKQRWGHGIIASYFCTTSSFIKKSGYSDGISNMRSDMTPSKEGHSVINITSSKGASIEMESVV